MIVRESIKFERGIDPKKSMNIGNPWIKIKPGDWIECIKRLIVEDETIVFTSPNSKILDGDSWIFDVGNAARVKMLESKKEGTELFLRLIPMKGITDLKYLGMFNNIEGFANIDTWAKYFKIVRQ